MFSKNNKVKKIIPKNVFQLFMQVEMIKDKIIIMKFKNHNFQVK
jgi:hypothetical protein